MLAADYPFLDVLWTMVIFFVWVLWFWLLFSIWGDIFRRNDINGWGKTGWLIFTIIVPFLGVFIYIITQHDGMNQRNLDRVQQQKAAMDSYVREAAGGSANEIAQAKKLLDDGTITQQEFERIKQQALAAG